MEKFLSGVSAFFYRLATRRNMLIALGLQLLFSAIIFPVAQYKFDMTGQIGIPDLHFGFSPEELYRIFTAYGEEGRRFYLWSEIFADSIYPLVYNGFGILLLGLVLKQLHLETGRWRLLNLWPLLTLAFDYVENAFIIQALLRFPERHDAAARIAAAAQCGKWATLGMGFVILVVLTALLLRRRL